MGKIEKTFYWLCLIVIIYTVFGFKILPGILKDQIEKNLNESLIEKTTIKKIEFNPFTFKAKVNRFNIGKKDSPTVNFDNLIVELDVFRSIRELNVSIENVQLEKMSLNIVEDEAGNINLSNLLKKQEKIKEKPTKDSTSEITFLISKLLLENSNIDYTKYNKDKPYKLSIKDIDLKIYDLGTYKNSLSSNRLTLKINEHTDVSFEGALRLEPFKAYGKAKIERLKMKDLRDFESKLLNFEVNEIANANLDFDYDINLENSTQVKLNSSKFDIENFYLFQDSKKVAGFKNLSIGKFIFDLDKQNISFNDIDSKDLKINMILNKQGVNFANLVNNSKEETKNTNNDSNKPWKINIKDINLKNNNFIFDDIVNSSQVESKNFDVKSNSILIDGSNVFVDNFTSLNPEVRYINNDLNINSVKTNLYIDNFSYKNDDIKIEKIKLLKENINLNNKNIDMNTGKTSVDIKKFNIKDSIVKMASSSIKTAFDFKDLSSQLNLNGSNIDILANKINIDGSKIDINDIKWQIPTFKLDEIEKDLEINLNNSKFLTKDLKIDNSNIKIATINIDTPKINFKDNKNGLDLILDKTILNSNNFSLDNSVIKISDINLEAPIFKFEDTKNKLKIDIKDSNIIFDKFSFNDSNINIKLAKLIKSNLQLEDLKNNLKIYTKKMNLVLDDISSKDDKLMINSLKLKEPSLKLLNTKEKTEILTENIDFSVFGISNSNKLLNIKNAQINNPILSITLPKSNNSKKEIKKKVKKDNSKSKNIHIGPLKILNAKFNFEDKSLPMPFKTTISKLNGEISDYSNKEKSISELKVKGIVNKYGVASIKGKVDPNSLKILTDVNMKFKNLAIKDFTPYSAKFIGQKLDGGKLELDLKYNIKKSNLKANNEVIINKLKLGEKVKSKDAVSLPLEVAILLLEDPSGVIDLNLPIKGNMNDPEFSIAPLVWKAFINLIAKAVNAPFSLLGAIFGFSADEIKNVQFDFGKDKITPIQMDTLDKIVKVLKKRPKLAIELIPAYDKYKDLSGLKKEKFKELVSKYSTNKEEYLIFLEKRYLNFDKDLENLKTQYISNENLDIEAYIKALEERLISLQKVNIRNLKELATNRVDNIKKYLLEKGIKGKQIKTSKEIEVKNNKTIGIDLKVAKI